jgi:hypothetical protein
MCVKCVDNFGIGFHPITKKIRGSMYQVSYSCTLMCATNSNNIFKKKLILTKN